MRRAVVAVVVCALVLAASAARAGDQRVDAALARAADFLVSRQDEDGAWRSGVHGSFRDGPSLTPHVVHALLAMRGGQSETERAIERGRAYLLTVTNDGLHFPVYTGATISRVIVPNERRAAAEWIAYIRARQLNEANGWSRADPEFGGWGYSPGVPRKPPAGQGRGLMMDSNVSATLYAVEALRAAGVPGDDPALADALVFLDRCQNVAPEASRVDERFDERFDDGGFFFMPNDAARNKAGPAGADRFGVQRFHSYGSATADGIRAMLACGRKTDDPRVAAAARWLERNFDPDHNAGTFNEDRAAVREGNYFYYCWSASHVLAALKRDELETTSGKVKWAASLRDALLRRQRPDGSWKNSVSDGREDDPLVATSFAVGALVMCNATFAAR